jgi:hypothetical protein
VQQGVPSEGAHGQTDTELDDELEDTTTGSTQQHHNANHSGQTDQKIGDGGIHILCGERELTLLGSTYTVITGLKQISQSSHERSVR